MGKLQATIKSEIERLAKRELHAVSVPLKREVGLLKISVSQLRKTVSSLERFATEKQKELARRGIRLEATPEEIKKSRLSPRLIKSLRKHLGVTQKELAILTGVTVGAAHKWEIGKFNPKVEKKAALVALRKLGRGEVKKLLEEKVSGTAKRKK
jgi:DNA-binding transcriptional regulator YiaG